jgi:hypothetical protein
VRFTFCIQGWLVQLVRIIVIVVVVAGAARWEPDVALPLIVGVFLGGWLMAGLPALAVA